MALRSGVRMNSKNSRRGPEFCEHDPLSAAVRQIRKSLQEDGARRIQPGQFADIGVEGVVGGGLKEFGEPPFNGSHGVEIQVPQEPDARPVAENLIH